MWVVKWGNALAVRLWAAFVEMLALKERDEAELHVAGRQDLGIAGEPGRKDLVRRLGEFRGRLPADFKFDREEANSR